MKRILDLVQVELFIFFSICPVYAEEKSTLLSFAIFT